MSMTHTSNAARRDARLTLRDNALAIVAHDLRSPLSTIAMAADLLREIDDDERRRHFLDIITNAARQADFLIHDLMDVTRIENGALRVDLRREQVGYLLESVTEQFAESAAQAGILLGCDVSSVRNTEVMADSRRCVQLLSNLIGNAIKFTPPGGFVRVAAHVRGAFVEVSIQDSGIGIEADELPHVFERFWQASHHHRAGAGLGLAIARGIVEGHGGHMRVRSRRGEGSTFTFTLPLAS
jgi:signal transduction histidine kinase